MKYALNHHKNFVNPFVSWFLGFMLFAVAWMVEINVMLVMQAMTSTMDIAMKYISLAAIVNIPRFYVTSLANNKMSKCGSLSLKITKTRSDNPLHGNSLYYKTLKFLRIIYKLERTLYCAFGYYFMPFIAIFINFKFMIKDPNAKTPHDISTAAS